MTKSAVKFLARSKVLPKTREVRQDAFATDRTQERKRPPTARKQK